MLRVCEKHDGYFVYESKHSYSADCPVCSEIDNLESKVEGLLLEIRALEEAKDA